MTEPVGPPNRAGAPDPAGVQASPMYARLLEAVLADEEVPQDGHRTQGPLAELLRLRRTMAKHATHDEPGWALQTVADQLAYDAALLRLARRRGVPVDTAWFDVPRRGRAQVEDALIDRGVNLPRTTLEEPAPATTPATTPATSEATTEATVESPAGPAGDAGA